MFFFFPDLSTISRSLHPQMEFPDSSSGCYMLRSVLLGNEGHGVSASVLSTDLLSTCVPEQHVEPPGPSVPALDYLCAWRSFQQHRLYCMCVFVRSEASTPSLRVCMCEACSHSVGAEALSAGWCDCIGMLIPEDCAEALCVTRSQTPLSTRED